MTYRYGILATSYDWRLLKQAEAAHVFRQTFSRASILPSVEVWEMALQRATVTDRQVTVALIGSDHRWSVYMVDTIWLAVETTAGDTYRVLELPREVVAKLPFSMKTRYNVGADYAYQYFERPIGADG